MLRGAIHKIRGIFLSQPTQRSDHLLFRHDDRAGQPLVHQTGVRGGDGKPSNKFLAFVPGVPQIRQLHEMLRRALDMGWTWGTDSTGVSCRALKSLRRWSLLIRWSSPKNNLGTNPHLYGPTAFTSNQAPREIQQKWEGLRSSRHVRSCIICTSEAESGVTIPHVRVSSAQVCIVVSLLM